MRAGSQITLTGAVVAALMVTSCVSAQADDLRYDPKDAQEAAAFKELVYQTRLCMRDFAQAMLMQGARDSEKIGASSVRICGAHLQRFMIRDLQRPEGEVLAFLQAMAHRELDRVPGVSRVPK